jgi:tripartite-type tricarboxylate transporter receptor subunit TctC
MQFRLTYVATGALLAAVLGCAPTTPAPTAAPAQPTEAPKPAATAAPAAPAAATAAPAAPTAVPTAAAKPAAAAPAKVDSKAIEEFYQGKTVRIIVGSGAGGGYDSYARAVARHLPKHIPGAPTVIVENMEGAGSLRAANHVYKVAAKDGTIIGHIQGGLFVQQLLGLQGIEFDALEYRVLGIPAVEKPLCVATAKSGIKSLQEVMNPGGKELVVGGNAPGSSIWDTAMRLRSALDLNLKMVDGYDGTARVRLAMDQGEVDGICGWGYESVRATGWDRVETGDYVVIAQVSEEPLEGLENVPLALQLAKTDEARQLIRLGSIVPGKVLRPFVMAPDVPQERIVALRQAFDAVWSDQEFIQDADKSKLELSPIPGEEAERLIRELMAMPEAVKSRLKQINEKSL